jgi:glycosyltransferase involved in cell wall biosynthesis
VFLEAAALLRGHPHLRFYVIGGPVYRSAGSQYELAELQQMAADLGIGERAGFPGYIEETPEAMRALDIVVHASTEPEPFGLTIAEAFACGRAVISSGLGGAAEVLGDPANAWTFRCRDAGDLARQIERLAASPELRARLGESGRQSALQRFDQRRFIGEVCALYASLAAANA